MRTANYLKPPYQRWTRKECVELERLWRANVTSQHIADRLNRSRSAVLGKLNRMGLLGIEHERRRARDERIARRYAEGEKAESLAFLHGISAKYVTQLARSYGYFRGAGRPPERKAA